MLKRFALSVVLAVILAVPAVQGSARPRSETQPHAIGLAHTAQAPRVPRGRLDTALDEIVSALESGGRVAAAREARAARVTVTGDRVSVAVWARSGAKEGAQRAVRESGGLVTGVAGDHVMADVPVAALAALSTHPTVRSVFSPPRPDAHEVMSEGVAEMNTSLLSLATSDHPAYTGEGIRVGIVDEGFTNYQVLLGGELPAAGAVHMWPGPLPPRPPKPDSDIYDSNHGTAVMEVVHDVAPDAELYIAAVDDPADIAEAVDWMLANKVHVINMSMGWWGWARVDGGGPINAPFDKAAAAGVTCVVSGGNYRRRHWHGDFDPGPETDVRRFLHNWVPGVEENQFVVNNGGWAEAWLWWDDWADTTQDFNLQLVRWDGAAWVEVAQSRDLQSSTKRPVEWIGETLTPGTYAWRIWKHSASRNDVDFDFFVVRGPSFTAGAPNQASTYERSVLQPADNRSAGVVTVAALGRATTGYAQEDYSSEGPTIDGRTGIDISGPSVVSTAVKGTNGFNGTSAAAPHVAGVAALMHEAESGISGTEVAQSLTAQTVDMGPAGTDRVFGAGRLALKPVPGLSCITNLATAGYEQPVTVVGRLTSGENALRGLPNVTVWRKQGPAGEWLQIGAAAWNDVFDAYVASVGFQQNGEVQLRFSGNSQLAARRSSPAAVRAKAYLPVPSVPRTTIRRGRTFTVSGLLKPRHTGGTRVELFKYVNGRPRLYRRYSVKVTTLDASTSRYTASVTAPSPGTWMVRATHSDATHASTISPGRRFSVK